jgi:hypothetical protein
MCMTAVRAAQLLDTARLTVEALLAEVDQLRHELRVAQLHAENIVAAASPDDRHRRTSTVQHIATCLTHCTDTVALTENLAPLIRDVEEWIDAELTFDPGPEPDAPAQPVPALAA